MTPRRNFRVRFTWPNGDFVQKEVRAMHHGTAKKIATASFGLTTRHLINKRAVRVKAAEIDKDDKPGDWK